MYWINHFLFSHLVREGFLPRGSWRWLKIQLLTLDTLLPPGQVILTAVLLVSHNHSLEKEDTPGKDHTGLVLGNSEQQDAKEGRLCSIKREACLLVSGGGCNCLLRITPLTGRELKPTTQGDAGIAPSPPAKEGCLARGPYPWEQNGVGKLALSPWKAIQISSNLKSAHGARP